MKRLLINWIQHDAASLNWNMVYIVTDEQGCNNRGGLGGFIPPNNWDPSPTKISIIHPPQKFSTRTKMSLSYRRIVSISLMKVNALKGFRNAVYCCIVPCQLANELLLINSSDNDTVLTTKGGGIDRSVNYIRLTGSHWLVYQVLLF